jgi:hypothetical protein
MTDRELLEAAAKAAGIKLWREDVFTTGLTHRVSDNGVLIWNPLADDGDALRLAVKLRLDVRINDFDTLCYRFVTRSAAETHADYTDPHAATRRAIVRAAASIGQKADPIRQP